MAQCNYYLVNPTGNITVLVESRFSTEVQPFVAKKLLELEKSGEQAGFIINEKSDDFDIKIRMSGGEFCGNACMAAAVVFLEKSRDFKKLVKVSISGCDEPVNVTVDEKTDSGYVCRVQMPRAESVGEITAVINGAETVLPIIHYKGISHILIKGRLSANYAETFVRNLSKELSCDALGLLFVNESLTSLTPLVYVPAVDALYWENSCASGTAALGEYLLKSDYKAFPIAVKEPGGILKISNNNGVCLEGKCRIEKYVNENDILNSVEF